jgi:formylglycine-generating enzyme required for sulfatase activity
MTTKCLCLGLLALFWSSAVFPGMGLAQDRGLIIREPMHQNVAVNQRTALVIGNSAYDSTPLRNPANDARSIAAALRDLGFDVVEKENLNQKDMKREVQAFGAKLQKGGIGLFYFAGHGMQVNGRNYLIPVGARIEHEKQVEYEAVDMGAVLSEMDYARNPMNIVILDACRDNPFARSFRSSAQGLAAVNAPGGTLIAYATAPGSVAGDGPGENGIYTGELIRTMRTPGLRIEDVFKQVRSAVRQVTDGKQIPWESSSLEGDFYFAATPADTGAGTTTVASHRSVAAATSSEAPLTRGGDNAARNSKTWKEPVTGMEFIWVPGGCFQMGSSDTETGRDADEGPVHQVCLDGYWMGRTEVTNGEYRKFQHKHDSKDYNGVSLNGDDQPAVYVSWDEAQSFMKWLMDQNGGQYSFRLPTEAEWEYACRAANEASRYWGDDPNQACTYENVADLTGKNKWGWEDIHSCDDSYVATAPVGRFQPNAYGLRDMLGNVAEWCQDTYKADAYARHWLNNPVNTEASGEDAHRVIRGGSWHGKPAESRCAMRASGLPAGRNDDLGFRVVRQP